MSRHHTITGLSIGSSNGKRPSGLSGFVFTTRYHGVDVFIGENASGKTYRAILGPSAVIEGLARSQTDTRKPYLDERPVNTLGTLTVETGDGTVQVSRDLEAQGGAAVRDADAAVREWIGSPPTSWNFSDFARASSGARGQVLDAVARAGGQMEQWDQARAIQETRTLLLAARDEQGDDEGTDHPLRGDYSGEGIDWCKPLDEVAAMLTETRDGSGWLQAAEVQAFDLHRDANAAQKSARAHADELWSALPQEAPGDLSAVETEREAAQQALSALTADADAVARAQAAAERHEREGQQRADAVTAAQQALDGLTPPAPLDDNGRVTAAEDALRGAEAALETDVPQCPDAPGLALQVTAARERVEKAQAALDAPVPGYSGPEPAALRVSLETKRGAVGGYRQRLTKARKAAEAATAQVQAAQQAGEQARDARDEARQAQVSAQARVTALESMTGADQCCRECGVSGPLGIGERLRDAVAELAGAGRRYSDADEAYQQARDAYTTAETARRDANVEEAEAFTALRDATAAAEQLARDIERAEERQANHAATVVAQRQAEVESARSALRDAEATLERRASEHEARVQRQRQEAVEDARSALEKAQAAWEADKADHGAAIARHEEAVKAARVRLDNARQALAEWEAAEAPAVPAGPDEEAVAAARARVADLEAQRDAIRDHRRDVAEANAAEDAAEDARTYWRACRALLAAVREARDRLARAAYGPIQDAARDLLADVDVPGFPRPYFHGPDQFGAETTRGPAPFSALSESEQKVTAAALVYALATVAGNPVRWAPIDSIEAIQADHRVALLRALTKAKAEGRVDNVTLTMATTAPGSDDFEEVLASLRTVDGLAIHVCHKPEKGGHEEVEIVGQVPVRSRPTAGGDTVDIPF